MAVVTRKGKRDSSQEVYVIKSNKLINIKPRQKYTLLQGRFILWSYSHISQENLNEGDELILCAQEFAELIDTDPSNIYREGKKFAHELLSKTIDIEEEDGGWVVVPWFSEIGYKNGKFYVKPSAKLIPHMKNLNSHYTRYSLQRALCLSSQYAIRLYELLIQFKKLKQRTFLYGELREKLGVSDQELKQFGHFRQKVLEISEREINNKTDIKISWQGIKKGRKYHKIQFEIEENSQAEGISLFSENEGLKAELANEMVNYGIKLEIGQRLIREHGIDKVAEKIEYLKFKLKGGAKIKFPGSFLVTAIEEDYMVNEMPQKLSEDDIALSELDKDIALKRRELDECRGAINGPLARYDTKLMEQYTETYDIIQGELEKLLNKRLNVTS